MQSHVFFPMTSRGQSDLFYGLSKHVPDMFMVSLAGFGSQSAGKDFRWTHVCRSDVSQTLRWKTVWTSKELNTSARFCILQHIFCPRDLWTLFDPAMHTPTFLSQRSKVSVDYCDISKVTSSRRGSELSRWWLLPPPKNHLLSPPTNSIKCKLPLYAHKRSSSCLLIGQPAGHLSTPGKAKCRFLWILDGYKEEIIKMFCVFVLIWDSRLPNRRKINNWPVSGRQSTPAHSCSQVRSDTTGAYLSLSVGWLLRKLSCCSRRQTLKAR